jgi:hypothetical protein
MLHHIKEFTLHWSCSLLSIHSHFHGGVALPCMCNWPIHDPLFSAPQASFQKQTNIKTTWSCQKQWSTHMEDQHSTPYLSNPASIHDRTNRRRSRLSLSLSCIIHYSLHSFLCVILGAYTFFKLIVILTFQYIFLFLNTSLYISLSLSIVFLRPKPFHFSLFFMPRADR